MPIHGQIWSKEGEARPQACFASVIGQGRSQQAGAYLGELRGAKEGVSASAGEKGGRGWLFANDTFTRGGDGSARDVCNCGFPCGVGAHTKRGLGFSTARADWRTLQGLSVDMSGLPGGRAKLACQAGTS